MSLADEIAAESQGSIADEIAAQLKQGGGSLADEIAASMSAPGERAGEAAGAALDRLATGEIRNAPATWGDVGSTLSEIALQAVTPPIPGLSWDKADQVAQSPQGKEAYWGTVVPAGIVGGSLLAGGAGAGLAAREALGLGTGAASRAAIAHARGQDVQDAVLSPGNIALDAGMSAIPELWQGAKAIGNALPSAMQAPFRAAGSAVADRAGQGAAWLRDAIASRSPRYGAQLVDESAGLHPADLFDRPPIPEPDYAALAKKPTPGLPAPQGRTGLQAVKETLWQGETRDLLSSSNPVAQSAGMMIRRANQLDKSVRNMVGAQLDPALAAIAPEASADVARALDTGIGTNVPRETADLARPLRQVERTMDDLRQGQGVWDQVPEERALDLMDTGLPAQKIGAGRFYSPAQTTDFYFPHQSVPAADTGRELSSIEQILADHPELTARQAMRRMGGMASGRTVGNARAGDMQDFSLSVHDVLPSYVNTEASRIANASVFGGKPVNLTLQTSQGIRDVAVGEKAAALYEHLVNTGAHDEARRFGSALVERYAPTTNYGGPIARSAARVTSNMALSHAALTQVGQAHTALVFAGGPTQVARGASFVDNNPLLKRLFEAGPQSADYTDYLSLGRGGPEAPSTIPTPMQAIHGIENWLRGPASYASVAAIDDVSQAAKAARDAGQPFTAGLVKRAAEMGTTPDFLADDLAHNGTLSTGTWLNSIQNLVDRWQHTTGAGELPAFLRSPSGALLGQYKSFGVKQSQLIMDDVLKPIFSGDATLRSLGLQRARDLALYGSTSNALNATLRSLGGGRGPTLKAMLQGAVTGPTGLAGDVAYGAADSMTPKYGDDPLTRLAEIPALNVPIQAGQDLLGGAYQPGKAAAGVLKLAGAVDPRIPMYGAAPLGLLRGLSR